MIKKSSKLLSFHVVAGAVLFNAAIVADQPADTGQRGQTGGGIARLLQQAGATTMKDSGQSPLTRKTMVVLQGLPNCRLAATLQMRD